MYSSKNKRRYIVIKYLGESETPEKVLEKIVQTITKAFGVVGLMHVNPRLVGRGPGSSFLISVDREGLDKFIAALVVTREHSFEVVKITGTIKKARRILSSSNIRRRDQGLT